MLQTGLLVMPQKVFLLSTADLHFSSMVKRHCCVLQPILKSHCCLHKNKFIFSFIWRNMYRSNILDILGRILTGPQLSLKYHSSFLKIGVILACFSTDGNSELVTDVLKLECKKLAKMSAFSLMILEGISVSLHALETSRFHNQ